jgi:hypothetical protein
VKPKDIYSHTRIIIAEIFQNMAAYSGFNIVQFSPQVAAHSVTGTGRTAI